MSTMARTRAWKTRREKYGPRGHGSSYSRISVSEPAFARLVAAVMGDETLSEGQVCKITGLDRIEVRRLADDGALLLQQKPIPGEWGANMMRRLFGALESAGRDEA